MLQYPLQQPHRARLLLPCLVAHWITERYILHKIRRSKFYVTPITWAHLTKAWSYLVCLPALMIAQSSTMDFPKTYVMAFPILRWLLLGHRTATSEIFRPVVSQSTIPLPLVRCLYPTCHQTPRTLHLLLAPRLVSPSSPARLRP